MTATYPCGEYLDGVWTGSLRLLGDYCVQLRIWSSLSRAVNATPTNSPPREKQTRFQDSHVEGPIIPGSAGRSHRVRKIGGSARHFGVE